MPCLYFHIFDTDCIYCHYGNQTMCMHRHDRDFANKVVLFVAFCLASQIQVCLAVLQLPAIGALLCPLRQFFENLCFAPVGEGDPAGEEHGFGSFVPGAVVVIAYQGEAPA